jgi:hypothetical protein
VGAALAAGAAEPEGAAGASAGFVVSEGMGDAGVVSTAEGTSGEVAGWLDDPQPPSRSAPAPRIRSLACSLFIASSLALRQKS